MRSMLLACLGISLFFVLKEYINHLINQYNYPFSWTLVSLKIGINYLLWIVLTPWAYSLTNQIQNKGKKPLFRWFGIVLGVLLLALVHQLVATRLNDFVYYLDSGYMKAFFGRNNMVSLVIGSFGSLIELMVIIAIFLAIDYQKRYLHNQKELIAAQLSSLQMQLHPHFLFNTLHSISSMIDIDPKKAQKMLTKMGALMRILLENDMEQMTTVEKEISFIKNYLDLEQIRYADKMQIQYHIDEAVMQAEIPNMILQPLVENAIKYGVVPAVDQGEIRIDIKRQNREDSQSDFMELKISNSSEKKREDTVVKGMGVGLKNIRKRLEGIYQSDFVFESRFINPSLYVAQINLPLKV